MHNRDECVPICSVVKRQMQIGIHESHDKIRQRQTLAKLHKFVYNTFTALSGELAVPCHSQSATVGLKVAGGFRRGKQESARSVDTKVLCNATLLTVSGWEHSSTTQHERVPQGSFGVATYRDTVSASTVNCKCAVFEKYQRPCESKVVPLQTIRLLQFRNSRFFILTYQFRVLSD